MSDDTPTQRLPETPDAPAEPGAAGELADERRKSRALLYTLIGVAAALVITIVVLLIVFLTGGDDAPQAAPTESTSATPTPTVSESPTPTPTPTVAPEPTVAPTQDPPPPPPPSPIVSFRPSTTDANCPDPNASVPITFNWNTTGESVSFGVGTDFADQQPYESGLPGVGGKTVDYQCSEDGPDQKYSIAVFHNGEVIARQTITIRD